MHRLHIVVSIALVAVAVPAAAIEVDPAAAAGPHRFVVGFHDMPALGEGDHYAGERVVDAVPDLGFLVVEAGNPTAFRARVQLDDNVRYVETDASDHQLHYTPNDYFYNHASNWGAKKIGAPLAWDATLGSTSVKVAMVDSGLNKGHEEYAGNARVLQGWNFYGGNNNPADERGCSFHGTHTTGIAGAPINNGKGFAGLSQHTILPIKIFGGGKCFAATASNIANALKYAADQGSHLSSNSWGGGSYSTAIHDAITYAHNKGTVHVASAGNSGCSNCIGNPWKPQAANVIIVTATDQNDAGATFNSKGPEVDVSAPGVYIGSSTSGTADYHIMDGTSQAAPQVTGTLALVKALNPTFGYSQLDGRIKTTAVDLGSAGQDDTFGAGRINAAAAVY